MKYMNRVLYTESGNIALVGDIRSARGDTGMQSQTGTRSENYTIGGPVLVLDDIRV